MVEALQQATVASQVSGRIVEVKVDAGQRVKKGELLMRIDAREVAEAAQAARSQLATLIEDACSRRGDTLEHRRACIHDTIREPETDWPWWLDYWQGVMARGREA